MVKDEKGKLKRFFQVINNITDTVASLTAMTIFVVVIWQIFGRLIGKPAPWTEELTRFAFIWLIYLGIGIGYRKVESARVTLLLKLLPKFIQKGSVWIYTLASIGFFVFMLIYGVELMSQQINTSEKSSVLLLPMWIIGLCMPASAIIGILNIIQSLLYDRALIQEEVKQ
ncbi:TRAP transporter small permease [Neobacillus rhizosphaerae]|uniref:TRAP transporter small permease n=1 Tax=Neobacillus rhizosphaerae TaxID=2880965 RepID=UPI003D273056